MSGSIPPLSLYVLMITLYSYFTCYFRRTELRYYPRFFVLYPVWPDSVVRIPVRPIQFRRTVRSTVQTSGWHEIRGVGEAQRGSRSLFTSHAVGRDDTSDTLMCNVESRIYRLRERHFDFDGQMLCVASAWRFFFLVRTPG
jgi:hypothetical protein